MKKIDIRKKNSKTIGRLLVMIPQIFAWAKGPAAASAHEDRYGLVKNLDRARIYVNCNRVGNLVISIRRFSRL
jgi:hypothetical protein